MPFALQLALIVSMLILTSVTAFAETCGDSDLYRSLQAAITKRTQLETTMQMVSAADEAFVPGQDLHLRMPRADDLLVIEDDSSDNPWQKFKESTRESLSQFDKLYGGAIVEQLYKRSIGYEKDLDRDYVLVYLGPSTKLSLIVATEEELLSLKAKIHQAYEASEKRVEDDPATSRNASGLLNVIDGIIADKNYILPCEAEKLNELLLSDSFSESIERFCSARHEANRPVDYGPMCTFGAAEDPPRFVERESICALENVNRKSVSPLPEFEVSESYLMFIYGYKVRQRFHLRVQGQQGPRGSIPLSVRQDLRFRLFGRLNSVE